MLNSNEPLIPARTHLPELTIKVIIFSIILATVLAASNAYLALKIGTTISASIPASVLALGILRFFRHSNVLESNIIQTAASAGEGIAAAIAYVLPAMIILHVWKGFPYWETAFITIIGGILGVLFSIPLRRVLLDLPVLRFPEGTATGNVLRISVKGGKYLKMLIFGGGIGALINFAEAGLQIIASNLELWFKPNNIIFGLEFGFNPATLAAGFIVGFEVGISLLVGLVLGWMVILPILSGYVPEHTSGTTYQMAMAIWSKQLRYVGVGMMLVGGVWTLLRLLKPIMTGLKLSYASLQKGLLAHGKIPRTERDFPFSLMVIGIIILTLCVYLLVTYHALYFHFHMSRQYIMSVTLIVTLFILISGFFLATVVGYFTGLVGATNNPLSGMLIMALLLLGVIFLLFFKGPVAADNIKNSALMIIIIALISAIVAISCENIQDLKAGQMVGATPWKQQFILCVGVIVSALVIGPILELLYNAYGIAGVFPRPGMNPSQMLAAPQSGLMAAIAQGLQLHGELPWGMITLGCLLAIIICVIDEYLRLKKRSLPALAVGLGIYLPPGVILPIVVGGFVSYLVRRKLYRGIQTTEQRERAHEKEQNGVLLACGLVAGAALMGVGLAIPFVIAGDSNALRVVGDGFTPIANLFGILTILGLCYWLYRVCQK